METIYLSQKDMLEICQDGDKYFLRYPTFNITMPEVVKEIPKEAVDSYLAGKHDGEELINYANFGFWKSKISQEDANIQFLRDNPEFLLIDTDRKRHYFSEKEFEELLKKAHKSLEWFCVQFRKSGEFYGKSSTMEEYNVALEKSLVDAGLKPNILLYNNDNSGNKK